MAKQWMDGNGVPIDPGRLVKNFRDGVTSPDELLFLLGRLTRFIRKFHGTLISDADDIASEIVIEAYEQIDQLHSDQAFEIWLYRIAREPIARRSKELKRLPAISRDASPVQTNELSPEEEEALWLQTGFVDTDESLLRTWALNGARGILSEEEQRVICLRIDQQWPSKDVAVEIGKSDVAVRQIESRACTKMLKHMVANGDWDLFRTEADISSRLEKKTKTSAVTAGSRA